jgi:ubiquinone/menaquinone biosynthesis C-methylase UbiE
LSDIEFPDGARVLEVGCGTGVLSRILARWPGVRSVVGVDSAPSLLAKAAALAAPLGNIEFRQADACALPFAPETFDLVAFDSTLCHVPGLERALFEAFRVLRPGGWLAAFDGDYATATVALDDHDPLQACVDATMLNSVHDRRVMRRLPSLARKAGFQPMRFRSHGFADTEGGPYMLSVIDRGVDILRSGGRISEATASALKAEARKRAEAGTFFGHIAYASLIARKDA